MDLGKGVLLLLALVQIVAAKVEEDTFVNIKNYNGEQVVLFYRSSGGYKKTMRIFKKAAKKVGKKLPGVKWRTCDGDKAANKKEFEDAQFGNKGTWIFTSTPEEGIVKYSSDVTVKKLAFHVLSKYAPFKDTAVVEVESEDDLFDRMDLSDNPKPQFVKFFEKWCQHCKRLKKTFLRASTALGSVVDFVEVECSKTADTKEFCQRNGVSSYPTLILFTGEKKIKFDGTESSILTYHKFFSEKLDVDVGDVEVMGVSIPGKNGKKKKKKKKKNKKQKKQKTEEDKPSKQAENMDLSSLGSVEPVSDSLGAGQVARIQELSREIQQLLAQAAEKQRELSLIVGGQKRASTTPSQSRKGKKVVIDPDDL